MPRNVFFSQNEVLLREVLEGKEIGSEDEKLLRRLVDSFEDLPSHTLYNLRTYLFRVRDSLEYYTLFELPEWDFILDDPKSYEMRLSDLKKMVSGFSSLRSSFGLVSSVGEYAVQVQLEVLSFFPAFLAVKRYVDFLYERIDQLEQRVQGLEFELKQQNKDIIQTEKGEVVLENKEKDSEEGEEFDEDLDELEEEESE